MISSNSWGRVAMVAALCAFVIVAAEAQTKPKPPPRLPPNASETSRIPAGVDTGSPATSDAQQLGTPVPPNASADRTELKTRSAAARAAARPKPAASAPDCTRRLKPDPGSVDGAAAPKSGLVGSAPAPVASGARKPVRVDCG